MRLGRTKSRRITPTDVARAREQRQLRLAVAALASPLLVFVALTYGPTGWDPMLMVPTEHFYIVSAALTAFGMALLVGVASVRTREPRTFALASGFLCVAGVFSVHGLMTPGMAFTDGFHNGLLISARLSLLLGSLCLFAATLQPPPRVAAFVARRHGPLMAAVAGLVAAYVVANLRFPALLDRVPTGAEQAFPGQPVPADLELRRTVGQSLSYLVLVVSVAAGLVAASRFARSFALTRSGAAAGIAAGTLLLAEAHVVQTFGETWHLSWWLYHGMMLVGFLIPMAAFARAHRRGSSLVEIVDGLVLSETLAKVEYSFPEAVNAFVSAVEERDVFLRGHMRRVCELAVAIADELNLTETELRAASYAALLHDLGKLGMPPTILHKPGRLTDDEFEVLKEHPARGFEMVASTRALAIAAPAIRWHHERLDGSGYPDALLGEQIPIEARIIAVADVWDALTSDRVYREAMSPRDAWAILDRERDTKLDSACVDALARVLVRRASQPRPVPITTPHPDLAAAG